MNFYILLTVHHVMILGEWPRWRTNSFLCITCVCGRVMCRLGL